MQAEPSSSSAHADGVTDAVVATLAVPVIRPLRAAGPWRRRVLLTAMVFAYPSAYMAPVLRPGTHAHLRNRFASPDLVTDFNGAIRFGQLLRSMHFPWSPTGLVSYPIGEDIWRWQTLSQLLQLLLMFLLSRVVSPVLTMNLVVFIGWVLTGAAVYALARRLRLSTGAAVAATVVAQMLPSTPTMAANYTSYVWVCVPLFVVIRVLDLCHAPSQRNFVWLVGSLAVTIVFDPYWFFFALAAVAICAVVERRALGAWLRSAPWWVKLTVIAGAVGPFVMVAGVIVLDRMSTERTTSRSLGVEGVSFIDVGLRRPSDWWSSGAEGVGIAVAAIGTITVVVTLVRRKHPVRVAAAGIVLAFVLLSTRTAVDLGPVHIGSVAEYVRFVMPGVRFFQRAALIAEAMLVVFAVLGLTSVARRLGSTGGRAAVFALVAVFVAAELTPLVHRSVSHRWDDFAAMRAVVDEADRPVLLALPFERRGRSWMEFSMFDSVATLNPLYDIGAIAATGLAASSGDASLAAFLASRGVTHVLAVQGDESYPIDFELTSPRFVPRESLVLDGFGQSPQDVVLYEVHAQPGDEWCTCRVGPHMYLLDGTAVEGDVVGLERADGLAWYWLNGPSLAIDLRRTIIAEAVRTGLVDRATLQLSFGNVPCGTARRVTVSQGSRTTTVDLDGSVNPRVELELDVATIDQPLRLMVDGPACTIDADPRTFVLQVFEPELVTSR